MAKRISLKKARQLYQKSKQQQQSNPMRKNKYVKKKSRLTNFITKLKIRWYKGNRPDLVEKLEKDEDAIK